MLKQDKLITWYRRGEQPCWRLLEGDCTKGQGEDNRTVIATFMPDADEDANFDEGEQNLIEQLEELTPGVYTLETRTTPTATKSRKAVAFRCYAETSEDSSVGRSAAKNDFDDYLGRIKAERESAIAQAREEFARELQIHDLQRDKRDLEKKISELASDNKDLSKRASEIEEKKVNYIGQAVAAITGMFMPQQQPAIGVVDGAPESSSDEERLKQVVMFLRQKEPDCWLDLLEGIVRVAQTEPKTYNMARGFLIRK